ncbi:MAG TPA: MjaI family restriction endonuclease [Flavobacteriaceae bacterium]|nr:MjaI family restriction endonuclease [Flavobacteriaceae bacterium]
MTKININNAEVQKIISGKVNEFPKYTTQILNLANNTAGGTRPKVVGQLSDLIQEFSGNTVSEWKEWYKGKHPEASQDACKKISIMIENYKAAMKEIDNTLIKKWVDDLLFVKTFSGLKFQGAIIEKIAALKNENHRLAEPEEENKGIDGYIGDQPVSVKPKSWKSKNLPELIKVPIIYYEKKKSGISVEYDDTAWKV